jgi:hypothetical protein
MVSEDANGWIKSRSCQSKRTKTLELAGKVMSEEEIESARKPEWAAR